MKKYLILENCESFLKSPREKMLAIKECATALHRADTVHCLTHIFATRESYVFANDSFSKKNGEEFSIKKMFYNGALATKAQNFMI